MMYNEEVQGRIKTVVNFFDTQQPRKKLHNSKLILILPYFLENKNWRPTSQLRRFLLMRKKQDLESWKTRPTRGRKL